MNSSFTGEPPALDDDEELPISVGWDVVAPVLRICRVVGCGVDGCVAVAIAPRIFARLVGWCCRVGQCSRSSPILEVASPSKQYNNEWSPNRFLTHCNTTTKIIATTQYKQASNLKKRTLRAHVWTMTLPVALKKGSADEKCRWEYEWKDEMKADNIWRIHKIVGGNKQDEV